MAGAACARTLADAGHVVRLFDKGRSVGGRMAQRRVDGACFDHGAQYLRVRDPAFAAAVADWQASGLVTAWAGAEAAAGGPVLAGVPAMNAPVKALLAGLVVETESLVAAISHGSGGWSIRGADGTGQGPFAAVVLAVPAPQAVDLLASIGPGHGADLILRLGGVQMAPCWSLLAAFVRRLPIDAAALRLSGPLAWAARNASKPGRGEVETWTVHAGPDWSREHLERRPEETAPLLLAAFAAATGIDLPAPSHLSAHRWRYALVERPLGGSCIWDSALRLGLCGDWCLGPRVEAAYLSGRALAAALAKDGPPL